MAFPVIAFQLYNLNDFDVKLFSDYQENNLYIARFAFEEHYPSTTDEDEGSSQRPDKLHLVNIGENKETLKQFPFNAMYKNELVNVKVGKSALTRSSFLLNQEYNYLLVLYFDTPETASKFEEYLTKLELPVETAETFDEYYTKKLDEIDATIFKESRGEKRLQRKLYRGMSTREVKFLSRYVKIIEEDAGLHDIYMKIIHEFDDEFLHSQNDKFEFDSTTQKPLI
ncbi:CYFA0S06e01068g1_1 [Cyberlindnera fabianii]|uniref:CYFA0S06e01068g1_1 n=1 Tax=Cyberlindnera fabianii TaxID=36022 RepID=A0A061B0D3_CYBFA|nr:hypothetical protein BON22_1217 [Cyberlindnera fabianii]CDR41072.1 CYFA0S06e01068g1_1 [Cyberlindnera fabianii]